MGTAIYLYVTSKGVRFVDPNRTREGSERAKVELRGYPVTFPCNSQYLKGTGFLDVLGFKSRSIR